MPRRTSMKWEEDYESDTEKFFKDDELNLDAVTKTLNIITKSNENFAKKLENLKIDITWKIPHLHESKKGIFRQKKLTYGLSNEEKEYLHTRLTKFCNKNNLDINDVRQISKSSTHYTLNAATRIKFLQYLCKRLSQRTPLSVYNYISKLGCRKGAFSPAEDNLLIELYKYYSGPNFFHVCSQLLNRPRLNIYLHFRRLREKVKLECPPVQERNNNISSEGVLKSVLARCKGAVNELPLKISNNSWRAIGRENNISPAMAKSVYLCDIVPRAKHKGPVYYYEMCCVLIESIQKVLEADLSSVLQPLESKHKISVIFFYFLLRKLIETSVPQQSWDNFSECRDVLVSEVLPVMKNKQRTEEDFILERFHIM